MNTRTFGHTDLKISPICYGTWQLGGFPFYKDHDEAHGEALIRYAFEKGITFFDTAPVYGFGKAEEILGRAVRDFRDKIVISTKCGLRWKDKTLQAIHKCASKPSILEEIDASLKRLQCDIIDLYLIHWPDKETPIGESIDTLETLKAKGKIRYYGLSNFSTEQIKEAQKYGCISGLQSRFSYLNRSLIDSELPFCAEQGIGFQAYSPLERGLLTAQSVEDLKARGEAAIHWAVKELSEDQKKDLNFLEKDAARKGISKAQWALDWVLEQVGLSCAIVGTTKEAHIDAAVDGCPSIS